MQQNVNTNIKADLSQYISKQGVSLIVLQTTINNIRVSLSTNLYVKPSDWDKNKRLVRKSNNNSQAYNLLINQLKSKINEIIIDFRLAKKQLSVSELKKIFYDSESNMNFIRWAFNEIKERKSEAVDMETLKLHTSVLNKLSKFCKGSLPFSELNAMFFSKYEKYLRDEVGNSISTINKDFRSIRTYVNRARRKEIIKGNPFDGYQIKKEIKTPECLTEEELSKIFKAFWENKTQSIDEKNVLRAFLFSCVTGLRKSDVQRIKYTHTKNKIIVMPIYKTRNTRPTIIRIPLTQTALKLIDDSTGTADGYIFPFPSAESRSLKMAIMRCGISKRVNYNMSRHTFATLYLRKNKKDLVTLKNLMGHSKIEQTMVYLTVDDEWLMEGMNNFSEFI